METDASRWNWVVRAVLEGIVVVVALSIAGPLTLTLVS